MTVLWTTLAFDGMRKHLAADFDRIYVLDLGGNVRKNPKISGTTHNVFGIQVGVSINLLVKLRDPNSRGRIFYFRMDENWRKDAKFALLDQSETCSGVKWQEIVPKGKYTWLTEGLRNDFETFLPLGTKKAKAGTGEAIFGLFSSGLQTNRDTWAYNFDTKALEANMRITITAYNEQLLKWSNHHPKGDIDDFVVSDDTRISWSSSLKSYLLQLIAVEYDSSKIRDGIYRPFVRSSVYFDRHFNHRRYQLPRIFPKPAAETEKLSYMPHRQGIEKPFVALMTNYLTDLHLVGAGCSTQCFPFYTYDQDGSNRRENITDWAVEQFSAALGSGVKRWQIFHYIYGLLHSPEYREKYQANLKRDLPRIPLPKTIEQFRAFASAGERLADLHVNYESQKEYPLEKIENPDKPLNWRVEKMKLTKDKTAIVYNDFLTLAGIPSEAFEYKLGNRSALEWIIDRYQVRTGQEERHRQRP